jgi:hypothetical protein
MDTIIASMLEKSVISGAFVLLLWHFINTNARQMDKFADQLGRFSDQMGKSNKSLDGISKTLSGFDVRLQRLEASVKDKKEDE